LNHVDELREAAAARDLAINTAVGAEPGAGYGLVSFS
jgi:hypothetical protein